MIKFIFVGVTEIEQLPDLGLFSLLSNCCFIMHAWLPAVYNYVLTEAPQMTTVGIVWHKNDVNVVLELCPVLLEFRCTCNWLSIIIANIINHFHYRLCWAKHNARFNPFSKCQTIDPGERWYGWDVSDFLMVALCSHFIGPAVGQFWSSCMMWRKYHFENMWLL